MDADASRRQSSRQTARGFMGTEPSDASNDHVDNGATGQHNGSVRRRDHLLEFLGMFMVLFAGSMLLFAVGYELSDGTITVQWLVANALTDLGFCLLVPVLLTRGESFDWKLPWTGRGWAKEFGWGLLLLIVIYVGDALVAQAFSPLGLDYSTHWDNPLAKPATLVTFCILLPIVGLSEELLFRVYVQTRLTQIMRGRRTLPVLVGAVLFAAVHGYPLAGTLSVLVMGLVLGFSYQINGKIPRLVIAHTMNNLLVALLTLM
jgi:membrane protease YdiL (CAAX protease family)